MLKLANVFLSISLSVTGLFSSTAFSQNTQSAEEKNKMIQSALAAGNQAYNRGDYDLAVAKYNEGIQVDPTWVGSAPVFYNNRGAALKKRAVDNYNKLLSAKDPSIRAKGIFKVAAELSNALDSYNKSYEILNKAGAADIIDQAAFKKNKYNALDGARDSIRIMTLIQAVDSSKGEEATSLTKAFLELETDKDKKGRAQIALSRYLLLAGAFNTAAVEFKKALEYGPYDPDVLAGLSIALFSSGNFNKSKQQLQESLNYMQVFLKIAPEDHKMRQDIQRNADYLKNTEKLKPQTINQ